MMVCKTICYMKAAHIGEGIPKVFLEQIELCETPLQLFGPSNGYFCKRKIDF